jgi:hypothetical protein
MLETSNKLSISIIREMPHLYELEEMVEFCERCEHLYILGAGVNQEYLLKFLDACNVKVDGYAVTNPSGQCLSIWRELPIVSVDEVLGQKGAGILVGLSERHYSAFIPKFKQRGFANYYTPTDFTKLAIANHLRPLQREEMYFEYLLAEHCNVSCQCCDHFSQHGEPKCVDIDVFSRDMTRLSWLFEGKIGSVRLVGGEPLLHKDIVKCMKISREAFPDAAIEVVTNGVLLKKLESAAQGNFWQACHDNNVSIVMTIYPIGLDVDELERLAEKYEVNFFASSNIHASEADHTTKITDKHTLQLNGKADKWGFASCFYLNYSNNVVNGKWSLCPCSANIGIFNKAFHQNLEVGEQDYVDIYKAADWKALAKFSSNRIPFCRYCDMKNWVLGYGEWKPSNKLISEYICEPGRPL